MRYSAVVFQCFMSVQRVLVAVYLIVHRQQSDLCDSHSYSTWMTLGSKCLKSGFLFIPSVLIPPDMLQRRRIFHFGYDWKSQWIPANC